MKSYKVSHEWMPSIKINDCQCRPGLEGHASNPNHRAPRGDSNQTQTIRQKLQNLEKKPDGLATLYSDRCLSGQLWSTTMTHSAYSLPPGSRMKEELRPEFLFLMPHSPYRVQLVPLRLIRKMGEEPFEKAVCKVCRMGDNINLKYGYKFILRLLNIAEITFV